MTGDEHRPLRLTGEVSFTGCAAESDGGLLHDSSSRQPRRLSAPRIENSATQFGKSNAVLLPGKRRLRQTNDLVVVDTPGTLNETTRTALILSDKVVLPLTPSVLDARGCAQACSALRYAQTITGGRPEGRLVLNRFRKRDTISRELIGAAGELGLTVCRTVIRDLKVYRDTPQQGTVVHRMPGAAAAEAAADLSDLFRELLADRLSNPSFADSRTAHLNKENEHEGQKNAFKRTWNNA